MASLVKSAMGLCLLGGVNDSKFRGTCKLAVYRYDLYLGESATTCMVDGGTTLASPSLAHLQTHALSEPLSHLATRLQVEHPAWVALCI